MNVFGYAALSKGDELKPFEYESPKLENGDVRVDVSHCGVCHTDIQAINNYYNITTYPFVPGHEIIGTVSEKGSEVVNLKIGDRVGIGWQGRSCMDCEWCKKGETQLCMKLENTTVMVPYGGFSTSVVANQEFVYKIPQKLPSEFAAVLMCAGLTVFSVLKTHIVENGLRVGVVGVGGLGHMAIQFAHACGCEVSAISSSASKGKQSLEFGAKHFINSSDGSLSKYDYYHDLLICTANDGIDWNTLLMTLKKRGRMILVGFPDIKMNSTDLVAHELTITGSLIGNPKMMKEMLLFSQKHNIKPLVEVMSMSQVNEAIQRVRGNKARYRIVLVNDVPVK